MEQFIHYAMQSSGNTTVNDMYTVANGRGKAIKRLTILDALDVLGVFSINKLNPDLFEVVESCDGHYDAHLTKEQMLALSDEIRELAEGVMK